MTYFLEYLKPLVTDIMLLQAVTLLVY